MGIINRILSHFFPATRRSAAAAELARQNARLGAGAQNIRNSEHEPQTQSPPQLPAAVQNSPRFNQRRQALIPNSDQQSNAAQGYQQGDILNAVRERGITAQGFDEHDAAATAMSTPSEPLVNHVEQQHELPPDYSVPAANILPPYYSPAAAPPSYEQVSENVSPEPTEPAPSYPPPAYSEQAPLGHRSGYDLALARYQAGELSVLQLREELLRQGLEPQTLIEQLLEQARSCRSQFRALMQDVSELRANNRLQEAVELEALATDLRLEFLDLRRLAESLTDLSQEGQQQQIAQMRAEFERIRMEVEEAQASANNRQPTSAAPTSAAAQIPSKPRFSPSEGDDDTAL